MELTSHITNKFRSRRGALALLLIPVLALTACTAASNLIIALNAVSEAASVAVVVAQNLPSVSPEDAALIANYATQVSNACSKSVTELNSSDSNTIKITTIGGYFASIVVPTAQQGIISAVQLAIQTFLQLLNGGQLGKAAALAPHTLPRLTHADHAMLSHIQKVSAETVAKAAALKAAKH